MAQSTQSSQDTGFRDLGQRIARVEAEGDAVAATLERMERTICRMDARLTEVQGDVRDAKTALRVGFWILTTIIPAGAAVLGWFAHTFWPGK
jgi:predicted RNase H-like nuclease (RuvC/YqgF family)